MNDEESPTEHPGTVSNLDAPFVVLPKWSLWAVVDDLAAQFDRRGFRSFDIRKLQPDIIEDRDAVVNVKEEAGHPHYPQETAARARTLPAKVRKGKQVDRPWTAEDALSREM
ncbi:hypothetical protein QA640_27265 [Bradyrhizobium sp. CB82]|uniref:hypothetical protein n=1 Tax=Bradyrhizobium sp. CB82 TaxID=3039159 RepID=UPI0024B0802B|nr:hypothetical protein [Bradyrhizobium sp. CB82]WFU38124.1 hypothetical protein QA640_27265 [Bradyrhizobium sp. CB82]